MVVLDLAFSTKKQRQYFYELARGINVNPEVHFLNASKKIRKERVEKRNIEKNPDVYTFEVSDMMFDFMEPKFEAPDQKELDNGCTIEVK